MAQRAHIKPSTALTGFRLLGLPWARREGWFGLKGTTIRSGTAQAVPCSGWLGKPSSKLTKTTNHKMHELHLFAGAGGGILGGMLLGHRPVCAVEIEPYCRKILLQRQRDGILPRFPIWDDVRTFDGQVPAALALAWNLLAPEQPERVAEE